MNKTWKIISGVIVILILFIFVLPVIPVKGEICADVYIEIGSNNKRPCSSVVTERRTLFQHIKYIKFIRQYEKNARYYSPEEIAELEKSKLRASLLELVKEYDQAMARGGGFIPPNDFLIKDGMVRIEATAKTDIKSLIKELKKLSATEISSSQFILNAWIPISNISHLLYIEELSFAKPVYPVITN